MQWGKGRTIAPYGLKAPPNVGSVCMGARQRKRGWTHMSRYPAGVMVCVMVCILSKYFPTFSNPMGDMAHTGLCLLNW